MILAKFGLYTTTGPSIAIGVGITILAVLTLTPAVIAVLGESIFWPAHPSKRIDKEKEGSKFWNKLSVAVTQKPVRFIIISLIVFTPFMVSTLGINRSFDELSELPSKSEALKGFQVIKDNFNQGEMLPITVVLKDNRDMWSNESLQGIDKIAKSILKVDGVAKVRTATRPEGDAISQENLLDFEEGLAQMKELQKQFAVQGKKAIPLIDKQSIAKMLNLTTEEVEKFMSLKEGMDNYISPSGNGINFQVVLSLPPYTEKALDSSQEIIKAIKSEIKGTTFQNA